MFHASFILEYQNELVDFCSINLRVMFSWIVINDSKPITLLLFLIVIVKIQKETILKI
jgi:hypothetical protein